MSEKKEGHKRNKSANSNPEKKINENDSIPEEERDYQSYMPYQTEMRPERNYLDNIFLSHKKEIVENKTKDPKSIREYNFDLEKTIELNIDLINKIPLKLTNPNEINSVKKLLAGIQEKNKLRIKKKNELKELKNNIVNDKQALICLKKTGEQEEIKLEKQYQSKEEKLAEREKYLKILNKRFKDIQNYIEKNFGGIIHQNFIDIPSFLAEKKNLKKEEQMIIDDSKRLREQIEEIKRENKKLKEESFLFKNKENDEFVRVINFYNGLILSVRTKTKVLKNSFANMTKTLNFMNLGDIVNFNEKKKKQNLDETFVEINLDKIYKGEDEDSFNCESKVKTLFDINESIKKNSG